MPFASALSRLSRVSRALGASRRCVARDARPASVGARARACVRVQRYRRLTRRSVAVVSSYIAAYQRAIHPNYTLCQGVVGRRRGAHILGKRRVQPVAAVVARAGVCNHFGVSDTRAERPLLLPLCTFW